MTPKEKAAMSVFTDLRISTRLAFSSYGASRRWRPLVSRW